MNNTKTTLIIAVVVVVSVYLYLYFQKNDKKIIIDDNAGVLNSSTLDIEAPDGYQKFVSQNKKLMFFYKEDWKCSEVVRDIRVDCYPNSRVEDEYEAGLDELTVYYPDISFYDNDGFCNPDIDDETIIEVNQDPLQYNNSGENYYGLFYQNFNNCLTKIVTLPYIDSVEKLEEIIKN